ncbi:MAG: hypothetical protein M0R38_12340 [Bacteroidia bacterium]|nr:hypothetical protein [Bacteroidia bacterium]
MSVERLTIDGYASLELNRVSFPITGRVVADVALNSGFNAATPAENGMILAIDYAVGEVVRPTNAAETRVLGLHFSPEKEYDPNLSGLNQFKLTAESTNDYQLRAQGFYPRLGLLSVGEKFTTNCLSYNTAAFANDAEVLAALDNCATTPVYGVPSSTGAIELVASLVGNEAVALQAIKNTTVPNGDVGVKLVVIKAQ